MGPGDDPPPGVTVTEVDARETELSCHCKLQKNENGDINVESGG